MGEVAALQAAFDAEFGKAVSSLPALHSCPPSEHDAHLNHYRASQRIVELVAYYGSRLPPWASVQRILHKAEQLVRLGEHRLARDACFEYVRALSLHAAPGVQRMEDTARMQCHVQARGAGRAGAGWQGWGGRAPASRGLRYRVVCWKGVGAPLP
jgi:hypothetical protein